MGQDPIQINRQTNNQIAPQFAAQTACMDDRLTERATRLIEQTPSGRRILDLGCGPGRDLSWFEAHGAHIVGADLSNGMLAEAQRVTKAGLCQMEMRRLGFAGQSFASVWCNAALIHLPKKEVPGALAEIARVLVSGGRFFVSIQKGCGECLEEDLRFFGLYGSCYFYQFWFTVRLPIFSAEINRFHKQGEFSSLVALTEQEAVETTQPMSGPFRRWRPYLHLLPFVLDGLYSRSFFRIGIK